MNSEVTNSEPETGQFDVAESRDLLVEVQQATAGSGQDDLHQFTSLVLQVIELHEEGEEDNAAEFIQASLQEIHSIVEADDPSYDRLAELREEAVQRWGHRMTIDELDPESTDDDWESSLPEESEAESNDVVAPTAEEISSMMSMLGQAAGSPEVVDTPSEPAAADPPSAEPEPVHDDSAAVSIASLDPELREAFMDDASSCVSSMEDSLLRLESNPSDADSLNQICRELHTLKGASASVGLSQLADQIHHLEDSLREDHTAGRAPCIDELLRSVDSIRSQISGGQPTCESTESSANPIESAPAVNVANEPSVAAPTPAAASLAPTFDEGPADDESVRVKSSQLNRLMDMLAELVMLRNRRETEVNELQEVYHELIGSVSKMRLLSNEGDNQTIASSSLQLSEVANDVLEVAQNVRTCARPVAEGNEAVSQFIRQFRQELVELRRTPVSGLFRRLQRVVRDAAQAESKEVRLQLVGEDSGIERTLQQRLYEPLLHIVRNSVCHGIETPDERTRAGKPTSGTITLEAKSGPDLLVIEIRDDGRGLDYDAIRRRGVEAGLLAADGAASREELAQLIFQPGFSTRQTANQVAGRGVGMDVVASTLQRMRGWLEVDSEPRWGTRIRLSFPLPSVIQHVMVFRSAGQLFALPMQSVQSAGEQECESVTLPFAQLMGQQDAAPTSQRIVLACDTPTAGDAGTVPARVTLLIDEIVGPEEVVVRPLPPILKQHPFCSGATLSGMGQTMLLLDARRIVETQRARLTRAAAGQADLSSPQQAQSSRPRVLVVDDSLSARKRVVRSLRRYPIDVVEASDGKQALEILKTQRFAAVFSDMEMPHVTGMELLAEVNSPDRENPPPVVIISSRGEDEFTLRAAELGVSSYLIKPLADEALDAAMTDIPKLRHLITHEPTRLQTSGENQ